MKMLIVVKLWMTCLSRLVLWWRVFQQRVLFLTVYSRYVGRYSGHCKPLSFAICSIPGLLFDFFLCLMIQAGILVVDRAIRNLSSCRNVQLPLYYTLSFQDLLPELSTTFACPSPLLWLFASPRGQFLFHVPVFLSLCKVLK